MFPARQCATHQNILQSARQLTRRLEPRPAQLRSPSLHFVHGASRPVTLPERGLSLPRLPRGRPQHHAVGVRPARQSLPPSRSSDHNVNPSHPSLCPFVKNKCLTISQRTMASLTAPTIVGLLVFFPKVPLLIWLSNRDLCNVEADQGESILGG